MRDTSVTWRDTGVIVTCLKQDRDLTIDVLVKFHVTITPVSRLCYVTSRIYHSNVISTVTEGSFTIFYDLGRGSCDLSKSFSSFATSFWIILKTITYRLWSI